MTDHVTLRVVFARHNITVFSVRSNRYLSPSGPEFFRPLLLFADQFRRIRLVDRLHHLLNVGTFLQIRNSAHGHALHSLGQGSLACENKNLQQLLPLFKSEE